MLMELILSACRMARLTEVIFFLFLPAWSFLLVDTFTLPGNSFYDFFMLGLGKVLLALVQMIFFFILLGFFIGELEMGRKKSQT